MLRILLLYLCGTLSVGQPDFFDNLRLNATEVASDYPHSAVYQVNTTDGRTVRLADLQVFLPFSINGLLRPGVVNDVLAAALAIQQTPCPDFGITMEVTNTRFSPIETTRAFTELLRRPISLQQPPPAAVVGAFRSAVTSPLAVLTGINRLPQVSWASTSSDFSDKEQYPYFGRTVSDTVGEAEVAVQFFQSMGATHVAIAFIADSFGTALQKAFQDAASKVGIETFSTAFPFNVDRATALAVAQQLKDTQYRHLYVIFYESQLDEMTAAGVEVGIIGPGYFGLVAGLDVYSLDLLVPKHLAPHLTGLGLIQMQGNIPRLPIFPSEPVPDEPVDPNTEYGRFVENWQTALRDSEFIDYVRSKLPADLNRFPGYNQSAVVFDNHPGSFRPFLYDAVAGLVQSFCRAGEKSTFPQGEEVYDEFRQMDFNGTSGRVLIDPATGTRAYETIQFIMWNIRALEDEDETSEVGRVGMYPTHSYENGYWVEIPGQSFVFNGGASVPPDSLPPRAKDFNYIGTPARAIGLSLMAITFISAILSVAWLLLNLREHVVESAQPIFLLLVSLGSVVMASSILPLSVEETIVPDIAGLDIACMAGPWLYIAGVSVVLSPIFAKTAGLYQAYTNPDLDVILISSKDIFVMCGILLSLNTVLLVVWTLVSPLEWTRVDESATDVFNRSTSSYGVCESDNSIAFVSLIGFVNFGLLLLGNWASYQCRNIETEYNESRYIGISMAATLQAWCMGVPILIVVWHNPQGRFYVQAGIVFVTTQAVLSTLYVPKVLHLYAARKKTRHDSGRESFAQIQQKSKMSFENMDSDDSAEQQPEALGVVASEAVDSQNSNPQAPPMGPSSGAFSDDPESEVLQAAAEMTAAALTPIDDKPQSVNTPVRGLSRKSQSSMSIRSRRGSDESGSREFSSSGASSARNLSDTSSIRHASQSSRHISQSSRNFSRSSRNFSQSSRSISDSRRDVWGVFQMGAHSSRAIDSASTKGGIKVLHNPRTDDALRIAGGQEVSRAQLNYIEAVTSTVDGHEGSRVASQDGSLLDFSSPRLDVGDLAEVEHESSTSEGPLNGDAALYN